MKTPVTDTFRERLISGEPLMGTFIKSPGFHAVEVLGEVGLDFVVLDAEHAPWDRAAIDVAVLAAKSQSLAALVRVESASHILTALDCGASGVMVPHVSSLQIAQDVAAMCRYRGGKRGFTNSSRAGNYGGLGMGAHLDQGDRRTTVIAMLEDPQALNEAPQIADVVGIDAFFLGRGDLTVAMGESSTDAATVQRAISVFVDAVKAANKPLCAFVSRSSEIAALRALGVTTFIVSSDQGLLRQAASAELTQFKQPTP